jgi:hypothetical protein
MSLDFMYSCVMDSTWFFLTGWMLLLLGAAVRAFRQDVARPMKQIESKGHN